MKRNRVEISGSHYASLIMARGCTLHDLDGSIKLFDSLRLMKGPSTPMFSKDTRRRLTTQNKIISLPDVLAYEAIINVVVTHHRIDLMEKYFAEMTTVDRVRPTAYIYNLLIRGYSFAGRFQQARDVFERMEDPPAGAAAPNNHAPHIGTAPRSESGNPSDVVYREVCVTFCSIFDISLTCDSSPLLGKRWYEQS